MKKTKKLLPVKQDHQSSVHQADEPEIINNTLNIWTVDDRGSFRRGDNHPSLIYLYTVLRWAVDGTYINEDVHDAAQIIRKNNSALASAQSLLADGIELGEIAVFNEHTCMKIGLSEKELLISHLRTMDVKNSVTGLVGECGLNYLLNGENLCRFLAGKIIATDDNFRKGALWQNLMHEVPSEWLAHTVQGEIKTAPVTNCQVAQENKSEAVLPGKKPRVASRIIATKAAWQIECETKRAASAKDVMSLLQTWADSGTVPEILIRSDKAKKGVMWTTANMKQVLFDLDACKKALNTWNKSRQ
jgi:hypothetical protein